MLVDHTDQESQYVGRAVPKIVTFFTGTPELLLPLLFLKKIILFIITCYNLTPLTIAINVN